MTGFGGYDWRLTMLEELLGGGSQASWDMNEANEGPNNKPPVHVKRS